MNQNTQQHHRLLDSGTTDHFISAKASVKDVRPTINKIKVTIPDGAILKSTHQCTIDWPSLPHQATTGYVIPALSDQSLLSVVKLCDNGCEVLFTRTKCTVYYKKK